MLAILQSRTTTAAVAALMIAVASGASGAVAAGLITSADIKNDTIRSVDIQDGAVRAHDLTSAMNVQLRHLARLTSYSQAFADVMVHPGQHVVRAPCKHANDGPRYVVLGGGFAVQPGVVVLYSQPGVRSWIVRVDNQTGVDQEVGVWATCTLSGVPDSQ